MNKQEILKRIIEDYKSHMGKCTVVEFHWQDGKKSGIGNNEIMEKLMVMVINEAQKQLDAINS